MLAVAEHDGTVAVLATGSGGASSPLYPARCTAGEYGTAQTAISRDWVMTYSGGAVGMGPDGTVDAVIDEAGVADGQDRGLVVATLSSSGDLGRSSSRRSATRMRTPALRVSHSRWTAPGGS